MARRGGADPWVDWIKFRVKNSSNSTLMCNIQLSLIDKMVIDGVELTPVNYYDFGDTTTYHDVYVLVNDFSATLDAMKIWQNSTISYADYPSKITKFGEGTLRNIGASQRCDVAIRSEIYPTFGPYNWVGWTAGHLYVPEGVYDDYVAANVITTSHIHKLEDYPYEWTNY